MVIKKSNTKPISKRKLAHKIFKFYKATGKFPPDVSTLQAYNLLVKYNYFIAEKIDKKNLNVLTEVCNILDNNKVIILHGDFLFKTLEFGLKKFLDIKGYTIEVVYINANDIKNIKNYFKNSLFIKTFNKTYIVYVIDDIEYLNDDDCKYILKIKRELYGYKKSIILCTNHIHKINKSFLFFRKLKFGKIYEQKYKYQKAIYILFNMVNRNNAVNELLKMDISYNYLFKLAAYNISIFYDTFNEVNNNLCFLSKGLNHIYETDIKMLISMVTYGFILSSKKKVIRFPPNEIIDKKNKEIYKNGKEKETN